MHNKNMDNLGSDGTEWDFIIQYQKTIQQECYNILGITPDAEDAAAEVGLRLHRFLSTSPDANERITYPKAWIRQVSRNYCIDFYRQRSRHQGLFMCVDDLSQFEHNDCPERKTLIHQAVSQLSDAIAELPVNLKHAILGRCIEGETYSQISSRSAISEANARKRVQLARRQLRQKVPEYSLTSDI